MSNPYFRKTCRKTKRAGRIGIYCIHDSRFLQSAVNISLISLYKSCIVSEKYYLCNVLIRPKAPMGRGWADIHMVKGVFVRFGFDDR